MTRTSTTDVRRGAGRSRTGLTGGGPITPFADLPLEPGVVVAALPRLPCGEILGSASSMFHNVWIGERPPGAPTPTRDQHSHTMAWTGGPPWTYYCGKRAELWVGYAVCREHAADALASDLLRMMHRRAHPACDWQTYHWSNTWRHHVLAVHPELFGEAPA